MAERKRKISVPRKQVSLQINELTEHQIKFLSDNGHGTLTEIVREAVNTLYLLKLEVMRRESIYKSENQS